VEVMMMTNKTEALKNLGHRPDQIKQLARKDTRHHQLIKGSDAESTGQAQQGSNNRRLNRGQRRPEHRRRINGQTPTDPVRWHAMRQDLSDYLRRLEGDEREER
jgi:hypothetical protein